MKYGMMKVNAGVEFFLLCLILCDIIQSLNLGSIEKIVCVP